MCSNISNSSQQICCFITRSTNMHNKSLDGITKIDQTLPNSVTIPQWVIRIYLLWSNNKIKIRNYFFKECNIIRSKKKVAITFFQKIKSPQT